MMLDHLGEHAAGAAVLAAVEDVVARSGDTLTPDLGGSGTTVGLGTAIADAVRAGHS
jgi:tartrate dehydrogenase/decarboxylase/D-malate dehydrogenase